MPVPRSIPELKNFLDKHAQEFGKINGEEVVSVKEDSVEVAGVCVPQKLYYKALVMGTALSYSKSQILVSGLTLFLADVNVWDDEPIPKPADQGWYTTEFLAVVPDNIYQLACSRAQAIGFNKSDLLTYALHLFVDSPGINAMYDAWMQASCEKYNANPQYIELKVLGWLKYQARLKRYQMSLEAGHFIEKAKLL